MARLLPTLLLASYGLAQMATQAASAQTPLSSFAKAPSNNWQVGTQTVPVAATTIITKTTQVNTAVVINTTTNPVLFTLADLSTNCTNAACTQAFLIPAADAAGHTQTLVIPLGGMRATNGLKWSAGTANALNAWVQGSY